MLSQCWLWHGIWCDCCIQLLAVNFLIFLQSFDRNSSEKEFSNNFLLYLRFSAFCLPLSDSYHFNWEVCTAVDFISSFDSERTFLDLLPNYVKKYVFLSTLTRTFCPFVEIIKLNWNSWRPLDCLESPESSCGLAKVLFRCTTFFELFLPCGKTYCDSHGL